MVVIDNDTVENEYVAEQGSSTIHPKERAVSHTPSIAPFTTFSSENDPSKVHAIAIVALENEPGTPIDMDNSGPDDVPGTTSQQMVDTLPNAPNSSAQADLLVTTSPNIEQKEANLMLLGNRKGMQSVVALQRIKMEVELDGNETNQTKDYDELDYEYENTHKNV